MNFQCGIESKNCGFRDIMLIAVVRIASRKEAFLIMGMVGCLANMSDMNDYILKLHFVSSATFLLHQPKSIVVYCQLPCSWAQV